jgi:hypothetical protein
MKNAKFVVSEALVGKYINRVLWSDVYPVGKIVAIKGKTKVVVQPVVASENLTKMEFVVGGFSAVCLNQWNQRYEFIEQGETFELPLSNNSMKKRFLDISEGPCKYHDYNF